MLLKRKLEPDRNTQQNTIVALDRMIENAVQEFENIIKRNYDIMATEKPFSVFIQGLQDDPAKGFANEHVQISK
jgi:hypothetical protein